MIPIRLRQASLLLFAMLISVVAFYQMFLRVYGHFPANYIGLLAVVGALFLVLWGLLLRFKPYASQAILPCVLMLTAIGVVMIARIDKSGNSSVGSRQLIWLCIALTLCGILVAVMRDYRVLRKYSYVNMVIGLILLLSPMIPVWGATSTAPRSGSASADIRCSPPNSPSCSSRSSSPPTCSTTATSSPWEARRCWDSSCPASRTSVRSSWCG